MGHLDPNAPATKAATRPVTAGDTINPVWNETLELDAWQPGESLEFVVYDRGLMGSKTQSKTTLPSEFFYPNGFRGVISLAGLPNARLRIEVLPATATAGTKQFSSMVVPLPLPYQGPAVVSSSSQPLGRRSFRAPLSSSSTLMPQHSPGFANTA